MFRKSKPRLVWRALPLRNEQLQRTSSATVLLPNQIWFTPETIISDAIDFTFDLLWLVYLLKKSLPISIFRIGVLAILLLIAVGFGQNAAISASSLPAQDSVLVGKSQVEIKTQIKTAERRFIAWPVPRTYISTYFSIHHQGIDIPSPHGRPVKPFSNGVVVFSAWGGGFGNLVQIKHDDGYLTKYAHLSSINVRVGQKVGKNTTIGTVGATGYATGAHLHFEIYKNGVAVNPLSILP